MRGGCLTAGAFFDIFFGPITIFFLFFTFLFFVSFVTFYSSLGWHYLKLHRVLVESIGDRHFFLHDPNGKGPYKQTVLTQIAKKSIVPLPTHVNRQHLPPSGSCKKKCRCPIKINFIKSKRNFTDLKIYLFIIDKPGTPALPGENTPTVQSW